MQRMFNANFSNHPFGLTSRADSRNSAVSEQSLDPYHSGKESECFQVFQDVAVLGGDQHHVELLHGLIDIPHALRLHKRVLLPRVHELGERCQQPLDAGARHLHELPGHDGLSRLCAHGCCQQHLRRR